jgi:sugar lactone lactonase YvrE
VSVAYQFLPLQLSPDLKVIPEAEPPVAAEVRETSATLQFTAGGATQSLAVGDLVGMGITEHTPNGYLGRVTGVQVVGDRVVVETERAELAEAVTSGAISFERDFVVDDVVEAEPLLEGVTLRRPGKSGGDQDPTAICASLGRAPILRGDEGALYFTGSTCVRPGVAFGIYFEGPDLRVFTGLDVWQEGHFVVEGEGRVEQQLRTAIPLMKVKLPPIQFHVGQFPVVIHPVIVLNAEVGGSVTGRFRYELNEIIHANAGARYEWGQWHGVSSFWHHEEFKSAGAITGFSVRAGIGPGLKLYFYGVLGPTAGVTPYAKFDVTFNQDPWWVLSLGVDAFVGVELTLFGYLTLAGFSATVLDLSWPIAWSPPGDTGPIILQVSPHDVTLAACDEATFTVGVTGAEHPELTWTALNGTVQGDGPTAVYRAPRYAGTDEVWVESVRQPGQNDWAYVTVTGEGAIASVVVHGLPVGVPPDVTFEREDGFTRAMPVGASWATCLAAGWYNLTARTIVADNQVWTPRIGEDEGAVVTMYDEVADGGRLDVTVQYQHLLGYLRVKADPVLPVPAAILVTGPFGYSRTLTAWDTQLQMLELGTYTVTASPLTVNSQLYTPVPATQEVVLGPHDWLEANIRYTSDSVKGLWVPTAGTYGVAFFQDPPTGFTSGIATGLATGCQGCTRQLAFDAVGNLWVGNAMDGNVHRFPHGQLGNNPAPDFTLPGPGSPEVVAFDAAGNLWVERNIYGETPPTQLSRYDAATVGQPGMTPSLTVGVDETYGGTTLAFDPDGNLWFGGFWALHVYSAASLAAGTPERVWTTGLRAADILFQPNGDAWFCTATPPPAKCFRVTAANLAAQTLDPAVTISGFAWGNPAGLTFDPSGNMWVSYSGGAGSYGAGLLKVEASALGADVTLPNVPPPTLWSYSYLPNAGKPRWLDR